jgi:hypothetical protein
LVGDEAQRLGEPRRRTAECPQHPPLRGGG